MTADDEVARIAAALHPGVRIGEGSYPLAVRAFSAGCRILDVDRLARAYHEASQVGGPFSPCTAPYGTPVDCLCREMAMDIVAGIR